MIEAVNIHIRIVLVALSTLFTHPCLANYPADNVPIFGITCANPDSVNISQLNFFNKEVKHGYLDSINSQKKLSSDDVIKIADIDRFPSEMLDRKNIQFKTKKNQYNELREMLLLCTTIQALFRCIS